MTKDTLPQRDGWKLVSDTKNGKEREIVYRHMKSGRGIWISLLPTTTGALKSNGDDPAKVKEWPHDIQIYDGPAHSGTAERVTVGGFGPWSFVLGEIEEAFNVTEAAVTKAVDA